MKRIVLIVCVALIGLSFQAKAQWAVIDPSNLAQNILTVSKTATTATNVINSFQEMQKDSYFEFFLTFSHGPKAAVLSHDLMFF